MIDRFNDDQKRFRILAAGPGCDPEIKPGRNALAEIYTKHETLPDGSKLVDSSSILAVWFV